NQGPTGQARSRAQVVARKAREKQGEVASPSALKDVSWVTPGICANCCSSGAATEDAIPRPTAHSTSQKRPARMRNREQRRRDRDLAAMAAALLAQQGLIDLVAGQREAVRRQAFTPWLNLGATPIHGAPHRACLR